MRWPSCDIAAIFLPPGAENGRYSTLEVPGDLFVTGLTGTNADDFRAICMG